MTDGYRPGPEESGIGNIENYRSGPEQMPDEVDGNASMKEGIAIVKGADGSHQIINKEGRGVSKTERMASGKIIIDDTGSRMQTNKPDQPVFDETKKVIGGNIFIDENGRQVGAAPGTERMTGGTIIIDEDGKKHYEPEK